MNSLIFKTLFGVLTAIGTVGTTLYIFRSVYDQNQKVDIFVTYESTKETTSDDFNDNVIKCKFKNLPDMNNEFDCAVNKNSSTTFFSEQHLNTGAFNQKINKASDIQNQYNKITVDKKIWNLWSKNKDKKIMIEQGNNIFAELSLLFGVQNNEILQTEDSNNNYFLIKTKFIDNDPNAATEISKSLTNHKSYECSTKENAKVFKDCKIYNFSNTEVSNLNGKKFVKQDNEVEKVKSEKYYLLDIGKEVYETKFIQTSGNADDVKKIEVEEIKKSIIRNNILFIIG